MVSHDCWTSTSRIAEVSAPGQDGKDDVLQGRSDESQGLSLEGFAKLYPTVRSLVLVKNRTLILVCSWSMSVARVAVEELEIDWKRAVQGLRGIVNHDRLLVLAPVTIPCQRATKNRKCGLRADSADL